MGIGGISIWNLLIILAIVVLLFGTKRLRGIGSDMGSAIKGFRNSLKDEPAEQEEAAKPQLSEHAKTDTSKDQQQASQAEQKDKV